MIMLTARAEEMDVIVGLGAGADDYVAQAVPAGRARRPHPRPLRVVEAAHQVTPMLEGGRCGSTATPAARISTAASSS